MSSTRNYDIEHFEIIFNEQEMDRLGYEILDFKMIFKENMHTNVKMKLKVKKSHFNNWELFLNDRSYIDTEDLSIVFLLNKRKYFSGVLSKMTKGMHDDGGYIVDIELESKSIMMDRNRYIEVYQNPMISYYDIIKQITTYYEEKVTIVGVTEKENNDTEYAKLNNKIEGGIIIQYNETDWEFIVRILSHLGLALHNSENGAVLIGFPRIQWKIWKLTKLIVIFMRL